MPISARERAAILKSLAAGVVPSIGLHWIQVGRFDEVAALIHDLDLVQQGGASVRFVIGRYGSGKTFFLNLIRTVAQKRKFVVAQADITTERRLQGSSGQAKALYCELMRNLSTQAKPDGGALQNVIERWVGDVDHDVRSNGGNEEVVKRKFATELRPLQDLVSGYDFVTVITRYYEGYLNHDERLQDNAVRWLRGEYTARTDARQDLGVRTIIDDTSYYDYLKLFARFVRIAGYAGLLVNIDELVVLSHRLPNTTARNRNYEAILRIINDCLQGRTEGLCFLFAGTDECLEDRRLGLYSYEALATRLAPNRFATEERQDLQSPVIRLQNLTPEDCFVLLSNIRHVHASGNPAQYIVPDEAIVEYLKECNEWMGSQCFQTVRRTAQGFVHFLNMLEQDSTRDWRSMLMRNASAIRQTLELPDAPDVNADDELSEFRL